MIVLTEWMGRSPKDVEDQITYPLSVALQAVPGSKSVRGKSMFGFSFVQVTFDDGVDFYWARSRVVEQLTTVSGSLPDGVTPNGWLSAISFYGIPSTLYTAALGLLPMFVFAHKYGS